MWRRAAAVLALAALVGALVIVAGGVLQRPGALVGAVLLLVVATMAAWYAAVQRGAFRIAAAVVAAGALAGVVILLLQHPARLALGVGLVVLATALARFALGRDLRTLAAQPTPGRPVPAAQRGVLIMNPKSGGGKVERFGLAEEARRRGIETVVLGPGDDLLQLAEDAAAGGADVIGMAGGDGSQALVASVAMRHDLAYVCVPAGTRNHLALDLGLDRDDVAGALDAFGAAVERRIDLARVGERVFVNNASLGVYAVAVQSEDYREAKLETVTRELPELLGPGAVPLDLRFAGPDGTSQAGAHIILVSNNPYRLAHLDGFGTRMGMDSGRLGIVVVRIPNARAAATLVGLQAMGRVRRFSGWQEWAVERFVIDSGGPVAIGIDGEALSLDPPLEFASLPGALRVRLPRAPRASLPPPGPCSRCATPRG